MLDVRSYRMKNLLGLVPPGECTVGMGSGVIACRAGQWPSNGAFKELKDIMHGTDDDEEKKRYGRNGHMSMMCKLLESF